MEEGWEGNGETSFWSPFNKEFKKNTTATGTETSIKKGLISRTMAVRVHYNFGTFLCRHLKTTTQNSGFLGKLNHSNKFFTFLFLIKYRAKLLNADWSMKRVFFLN